MTVLAWERIGGVLRQESRPARRFAAQVDWILDALIPVVGLERAARRRGAVALSLDGNHREIYSVGLPLLAGRGLTATLYVATGTVGAACGGGSGATLTWSMVREILEAGWEIGSRGVSGRGMHALTDEELREELTRSRGDLEAALGVRCRHLALSGGTLDRRLLEAARAAGYGTMAVWAARTGAAVAAPEVLPRSRVGPDTPWWRFRLQAWGWEARPGASGPGHPDGSIPRACD